MSVEQIKAYAIMEAVSTPLEVIDAIVLGDGLAETVTLTLMNVITQHFAVMDHVPILKGVIPVVAIKDILDIIVSHI